MGINSKLFISDRFTLDEVKSVIESRFETKVQAELSGVSCDYLKFIFSVQDPLTKKAEDRQMNVFTNYNSAGFRGTLIDLGTWGQANEILEALAKVFGGFYQPNDCEYDYRAMDGSLNESNGIPFYVRHAIVNSDINPDDIDALKSFIDKKEQEYKRFTKK